MLIINKLYSDPKIFDPITFERGFNLILGETSENNDKTNGVGKSLCIEFLNYALLKDHDRSRVSRIPKNELPENLEICLDFELSGKSLTIRRNIEKENSPILFVDGKKKPSATKDEILDYLTSLTFGSISNKETPSFRNMLGPLIRDEKSEFKSIIKCFDTDKRIPPDYTPHLFLLGINPEPYTEAVKLAKELVKIKAAKSKTKENIETLTNKSVSEAKADLNDLKNQVDKTQSDIDRLENIEGFDIVKDEIIEIEDLVEAKRSRHEVLKSELSKIKLFKGDNYIEDNEVAEIYNQFKEGLGDLIKKELEEVSSFKKKIDNFQKSLIDDRRQYIQGELNNIDTELKSLDQRYKEKVSLLDQEGLLKNLKQTIAIHQNKVEEFSSLDSLLSAYSNHENDRKDKDIERKNQIHTLDLFVIESKDEIKEVEKSILAIHEYVYGNQQCSFDIEVRENKEILKYDLRIYDDGSHSIDREKVFFYDYTLLTSTETCERHPGLLIHDNIFEVDRDTLIKNLNYIQDNIGRISEKQYIVTLNSDKFSAEDFKLLKLDIESYKRAAFTKENRFLNMHYQET